MTIGLDPCWGSFDFEVVVCFGVVVVVVYVKPEYVAGRLWCF